MSLLLGTLPQHCPTPPYPHTWLELLKVWPLFPELGKICQAIVMPSKAREPLLSMVIFFIWEKFRVANTGNYAFPEASGRWKWKCWQVEPPSVYFLSELWRGTPFLLALFLKLPVGETLTKMPVRFNLLTTQMITDLPRNVFGGLPFRRGITWGLPSKLLRWVLLVLDTAL